MIPMPRSFLAAFEAWKADQSYQIGPDIGSEFYDYNEARPTRVDRSSALTNNGSKNPIKEKLDSR